MFDRITQDIQAAMRKQDKFRLAVLRFLKSAIKNKEIELKKKLSEAECEDVLQAQVKSREQAIELYLKGGRNDLAQHEQDEIQVIREYLPQPLSETELAEEVSAAVEELEASGMQDMGRTMKYLKGKLGSRADGKILSSLVRAKLIN